MAVPDALARSALAGRKQPYGWAWVLSVLLHGGLVGGLFAATLLVDRTPPPPMQKPMLVRLGQPRDSKLLPRKPTAPPVPPAVKEAPVAMPGEKVAPLPPTPTPAPTPPKPEAPAAKTTPAPTPAAAPATQAAAPRDAKQDNKAKLDDIMKRFATGAIAGPAEPLPGALDGHVDGDSDRAEGEAYYALLEKRIKDQYKLPATLSERERMYLTATVRIYIEANGRIARHQIVQGSGNGVFDSALESAVQRASPVPPPPPHLVRTLQREGVDLLFKPQ